MPRANRAKPSRPRPKGLGKRKDIKSPLPPDFNLKDELFPVFKKKPVQKLRN